jgi:hypothetical protein
VTEPIVFTEEKTFNLRLNLEVAFPDAYDGDDDHHAWLSDWEDGMKGEVIKAVFAALRRHPSWTAHVRNRGVSAADEIEIVVVQTMS